MPCFSYTHFHCKKFFLHAALMKVKLFSSSWMIPIKINIFCHLCLLWKKKLENPWFNLKLIGSTNVPYESSPLRSISNIKIFYNVWLFCVSLITLLFVSFPSVFDDSLTRRYFVWNHSLTNNIRNKFVDTDRKVRRASLSASRCKQTNHSAWKWKFVHDYPAW